MPFHWKFRMPDDVDEGVSVILYVSVGLDFIVLRSINAIFEVACLIIVLVDYIWHQNKNK